LVSLDHDSTRGRETLEALAQAIARRQLDATGIWSDGREEAASAPIEDYALLSDLQTAALVHRHGSIDWACFPRFDSGASFAALLGGPEHGRWLIAPVARVTSSMRRYRTDTLILETVLETDEGAVRLIEFMPPRGRTPDIVRIVEGLRGTVRMHTELVIRFDFGRIVPWVQRLDHARVAVAGPDALCIRSPVELHGENLTTVGEFTVREGERLPFVVTWFPSHEELPTPVDPELELRDTEEYWQNWCTMNGYSGPYHEEIHRSLIVLKGLTYAPTGGIVAAPTTSLPEQLGGPRNWDYRFCWLRDSTLTLLAMLHAGYTEEAEHWRQWLLRAVAGDPADLQIMYGIAGERRLDERLLDWLPGYASSYPVRDGNAASEQLQLDVYGNVLDALYQARKHGLSADDDVWSLCLRMLDYLEEGWRQPDAGIWEVRGPRRHFTHSKVMAWVAFDRGIRAIQEFDRDGPIERWQALLDEIHAEVLDRAWSETRQAFTQSYDSEDLDASVLLIPAVGFLPADDPRFVATVETIRRELTVEGLVLRYHPRLDGGVDGIGAGEGVFLPCSFWLADALALQGRVDEARELFERLLDLRNDVGLLSEEYDAREGRQLGNFPQAFTHLALVNTAFTLSEGQGMRDAEATD
jgi:GH15 family glucan-1,4-alpha-glucosidase